MKASALGTIVSRSLDSHKLRTVKHLNRVRHVGAANQDTKASNGAVGNPIHNKGVSEATDNTGQINHVAPEQQPSLEDDSSPPLRLSDLLGDTPLVLVGMMGAGKTTIGRRLAKRIGRRFVDADQEIEKAANMSVAEIFEVHGEPSFRDGERRVIARLIKEPKIVLATGGGAYMDEETRNTLRHAAITIWLKAEFDVLMARVARKSTRPLLKKPNPERILRDLIEARYPTYKQADLTITSRDVPHSVIVDEIIECLIAYLSTNKLVRPTSDEASGESGA